MITLRGERPYSGWEAAEICMSRAFFVALCLSTVIAGTALAAPSRQPGVLASKASDAHRAGPNGAYGGLKYNARPPLRHDDNANRQPYYYRYYSDTDRSPTSCRRYAQRAIDTENSNWWTRYRACLK